MLRNLRPKFWSSSVLFTVILYHLRLSDAMWAKPWWYKKLRPLLQTIASTFTDIQKVFIFLGRSATHFSELLNLYMSRIHVCHDLGLSNLEYRYVKSSINFFTIPEHAQRTSTSWWKTQVKTLLLVPIISIFIFISLNCLLVTGEQIYR